MFFLMEPTQFDFIFGFYAKFLISGALFYQNSELQGSFRKFVPSKSLHIN
jgi:hypothetical protein